MRRTWYTLALMLALVAGLAVWFMYRSPEPKMQRERLSALAAQQVRELKIEWPQQPAVIVRKDGETWRVVAPHTSRADSLQVERVLSILEATSDLALPATELAQFELDRPRLRVSIDDESYSFGAVNPLTGSIYVLRGDRVLLIEARHAGALPQSPEALNDKRLLARDEDPVSFAFPGFTVAQQDGQWRVTPNDEAVSQDEVLHWVEGWRLASALRAEPSAASVPARHIAIGLRDGRRVMMSVMERDGEIAFSRHDENMRYYLFPNGARRLLAPPARSRQEGPSK